MAELERIQFCQPAPGLDGPPGGLASQAVIEAEVDDDVTGGLHHIDGLERRAAGPAPGS